MSDLFQNAQIGDTVAIIGRRGVITKSTITALTKTQVTVDGAKFTRSRGLEISGTIGDWDKRDIRPWTAEVEASLAARAEDVERTTRKTQAIAALAKAAHRITGPFLDLTDDQIKAIAELADGLDTAITGILGGPKDGAA